MRAAFVAFRPSREIMLYGAIAWLVVTCATTGALPALAYDINGPASIVPGVIVGSPSGLARPFTVTILNSAATQPVSTSVTSEFWLGYGVDPSEAICETPFPLAYSGPGGDTFECHDPHVNHPTVTWPYSEIPNPDGPATFHPRFGGRCDQGEQVVVQVGLPPGDTHGYISIRCVEARSTDFDGDGDTDQADKLEIGHAIKSGTPGTWYNLNTDDVNNSTIDAGDYMVIVDEMARSVYAACNCVGVTEVEPQCDPDAGSHQFALDDSHPQASTLSLVSFSGGNLTLSWTSPGDDYDASQAIGLPAEYILKYSNSPITSGNFASATRYGSAETITPHLAGATESVTINTGSNPARYWAIQTKDHSGNLSTVSSALDVGALIPISTVTACATYKTCILVGWADPTSATFDLRYSTSNIDESNFASASQLTVSAPSGGIAEKRATGLAQGTTYYFAVKWQDSSGHWSPISNVVSSTTLTSGTTCNTNTHCTGDWGFATRFPATDAALELSAPSPSPTGSSATFFYGVPDASSDERIDLSVFDVTGRRVTTLVDGTAKPGRWNQTWDLRDGRGADVRAGVYFVRMTLGDQKLMQRVIVTPR